MNIQSIEQDLLGICLNNTRYFANIEPFWFNNTLYSDIKKLDEFCQRNQVSKVGRIHLEELNINSPQMLMALTISIHKYSSMDPVEIKREFLVDTEAIVHNYKKQSLITKLNSATALAKAGKYYDAVDTLKTIDYAPKEKPETSNISMLNALKDKPGIKTGLAFIDNAGGWRQGNIVQITGDNGSMKTTISLWMCLKILMQNPTWKCLYFEKEMPKRDISLKLISYLLQIPTDKLDPEIEDTLKEYLDKESPLTNAIKRLTIISSSAFDNATDMANIIEYHKPEIWCLDYLTMLFEDAQQGDTFSFVNKQLQILKSCTANTNSIGIILSQIKQNVLTTKSVKIPDKADSEWSSKLNQYSAYIYTTFYPQLYHSIENNYFFLVQLKNRFSKRNNGYLIASPEISSFVEAKQDVLQAMINWLHGYYQGKYK